MEFEVKIKGVTPMMQHRMDDKKLAEWEKNRKQIIERAGLNEEDVKLAEFHSYINPDTGKFYIPCEHIRAALINGGTFLKAKVGVRTKSLKSIVAAMFMVSPEEIPLPPFDTIDKRSAVNKNVKARIMVTRPKWLKWTADFILTIGEDTITTETIEELIKTTGTYVGIGSYRPLCNGYFGRFELISLKKIEEKKK